MKDNSVYLAKKGLLEQIHNLKDHFLDLSASFALPHNTKSWKDLQNQSMRHSLEMELFGLKGAELTREKRKGMKYLTDAFNFGIQNYTGELNNSLLVDLGSKIEPQFNSRGYRNCGCRLLRPNREGYYFPPSHEEIQDELDYFLFENNSITNPLEKAGHAHFHISRIHPFGDGNGRVARLIQNIILQHGGYFPIVFKKQEKITYISFLDSAVNSYNQAISSLENIPLFLELKGNLIKSNFTNKEKEHYKSLSLRMLAKKLTSDVLKFCNFMLEKEKKILELECKKIEQVIKLNPHKIKK